MITMISLNVVKKAMAYTSYYDQFVEHLDPEGETVNANPEDKVELLLCYLNAEGANYRGK